MSRVKSMEVETISVFLAWAWNPVNISLKKTKSGVQGTEEEGNKR